MAAADRGHGVTEVRVDASVLESLIGKLETADLSEEERQLLDALLVIAGDVIARAGPVPVAARVEEPEDGDSAPYVVIDTEGLGPLRDQLKNAFTRGRLPSRVDRPLVRMHEVPQPDPRPSIGGEPTWEGPPRRDEPPPPDDT
jgi:hypothetical protein